MKLSQYAKREGIGYRAAWQRWRLGRIEGAYLDSSGHVYVPSLQESRLPKVAVYARVSSDSQKTILSVSPNAWSLTPKRAGSR
jgi:predicted site-specific integrase-resolvase